MESVSTKSPSPVGCSTGVEAQRRERLGAHLEPCPDRDGVGRDAVAVAQLDRGDMPVVAGDDAPDALVDDVHPGRSQGLDAGVTGVDAVVEHQGEPCAELPEQAGRVEPRRMGDDLDDPAVADLEPVAERAVDDVATPVVGEALDVGEHVDQTGGGEHPAGDQRVAADELDAEVIVVGPGHLDHAAVDHLAAVAADLVATDRGQRRGRHAVVSEVAVQVRGGGVARLAGVDDDHRAALATELERGRESGGRSADDRDVAVALDRAVFVVAHASRVRSIPAFAIDLAKFARSRGR